MLGSNYKIKYNNGFENKNHYYQKMPEPLISVLQNGGCSGTMTV